MRLLLTFTVKVEGSKDIDKAINGFFTEANKCLANVLMNPLYKQKDEIKSPVFEEKISNLGKEYLKLILEKKK